jgi:hypothetical protein
LKIPIDTNKANPVKNPILFALQTNKKQPPAPSGNTTIVDEKGEIAGIDE